MQVQREIKSLITDDLTSSGDDDYEEDEEIEEESGLNILSNLIMRFYLLSVINFIYST